MGMDTTAALAILGTASSVVGLLVAAVQGIRLRELRRRTNADVWLSIRTTRSMIGKLETGEARKQSQVAEVYGKLTELFCHLLKKAILEERNFTEDTIHRWRAANKLNSDWQEAQARQFLHTSAIGRPSTSKEAAEPKDGKSGKPTKSI